MAEQLIGKFADERFSPTYLRNATAYGSSPRLRADIVVNNLTGAALTRGEVRLQSDGSPWRPLVHAEDISRAFLAVLSADREVIHDQAFNVGRDEDVVQIRTIANAVAEKTGAPVTFAEGASPDKRDYRVDFTKIGRLLPEFQPAWTVPAGHRPARGRHGQLRAHRRGVRAHLRAAGADQPAHGRGPPRRAPPTSRCRADHTGVIPGGGRSRQVSAPRVAVVVVTYNSADVLSACLESLRHGGADGVELTDVVVVDNASDDATTEIAKAFDGLPITVVQLLENVGYAAGLNAGVTALGSRPPDAVMLLNPDCRLRPGALATLAGDLQVPGRGIVAPRLVNPDGTLQPTLRRLPTVSGVFAESFLGGRIADRVGLGELIFTDGPHAQAGHRRPG